MSSHSGGARLGSSQSTRGRGNPLGTRLAHYDRLIARLSERAAAAPSRARGDQATRAAWQAQLARAQVARERAVGRLTERMGKDALRVPEMRNVVARTQQEFDNYKRYEQYRGSTYTRALGAELRRYKTGDFSPPPLSTPRSEHESLAVRAARLGMDAQRYRVWERLGPGADVGRGRSDYAAGQRNLLHVKDAELEAITARNRHDSAVAAQRQARADAAAIRAASKTPAYREVLAGQRVTVQRGDREPFQVTARAIGDDRYAVNIFDAGARRPFESHVSVSRAQLARALEGVTYLSSMPSRSRTKKSA